MRLWPKPKVIERLVIRADVEHQVVTKATGDGLYETKLFCPCSRIHVLVHYQPLGGLDDNR